MKLNVGCGQDIRNTNEWVHLDRNPQHHDVRPIDIDDNGLRMFDDNSFEDVLCKGCLNEFKTDVVAVMNEFWRVLKPNGVLDITVAVVDNGLGPYRDPLAHRYLHSDWVQYFFIEGKWATSGKGIGFIGYFTLLENSVGGEVHHVVLKALK